LAHNKKAFICVVQTSIANRQVFFYYPILIFMSNYYENQKQSAAAWILRSLCTNSLWFDETKEKKGSARNYLFIPLFNIAQSSGKYDLNTLKESCYLLQKNNHVTIWGDDFDPRAMLVQVSDEGITAYKKSFYGSYNLAVIKKGITAIAVAAAVVAIVIGIGRYTSGMRHEKYQRNAQEKNGASDVSQKSTTLLQVR
jgi:hypothetical protein